MIIIFQIAYQVILWLANRFIIKDRKLKNVFLMLSTIAIVFWGFQYGFEDFLSFNLIIILVCPAAAYLTYLISLFIVGTKFEKKNLIPFECFRYKGKLFRMFRNESLRNVVSSTYEELLYRWFLFNAISLLTKSVLLSGIITSVSFFAVHISKEKAIVQHIDILAFSILITVFFALTKNPLYCIMIHILRNQLVICQKYVYIKRENDRKLELFVIIRNRRQLNEQ